MGSYKVKARNTSRSGPRPKSNRPKPLTEVKSIANIVAEEYWKTVYKRDKTIIKMGDAGYTQDEIAKYLGMANNSGIYKRINNLRKNYERKTGINISNSFLYHFWAHDKHTVFKQHAAELLSLKEVPAFVYFIDRDEATILMVDSNCQRETLSPIEKAKAYKMKLDAIKHQGTSSQIETKLRSDEQVAKDSGDSRATVQRLIRLTYLVPELQEYVDEGKMKVSPAIEISFLDEEQQRDIVDRIDETEIFPSHAQARRMKQLAGEGNLDYDSIKEIMSELKPNQVEKVKIPMDSIRQYAPRGSTPKDMENMRLII